MTPRPRGRRDARGRARRAVALLTLTALLGSVLALTVAVLDPVAPAHALSPDKVNLTSIAGGGDLVSAKYTHLERDGNLSVPLPGNKTLWIFADTTGDSFSLKGSSAISDNSKPWLTWEYTGGYGQVVPLLPGAYTPCPLGQTTSAWPTSAMAVPQSPTTTLIIIYYQANCAILGSTYALPRTMGVATAWYDSNNPNVAMQATVVNQSVFPLMNRQGAGGVGGYGAAAVYNDWDQNVYVYGCDYNSVGVPTCRLGRTFAGNVATPSAYTFWNGSSFVANPYAAAPVDIGGIISVGPNVQWMPAMNRYVSLNNPYSLPIMEIRTSPSPWGPWSQAGTADAGDCTSPIVCRTTALHPQFSDSRSVAVSYTPSSTEGTKLGMLPMSIDPFGSVEAVVPGVGAINASGWALDPDVSTPIPIAIYSDGVGIGQYTASGPRSDVASAFPGYGAAHGYNVTFAAAVGVHNVCVYAISQSVGITNTLIQCRVVQVLGPPSVPLLVGAQAGDTQALVAWSPPANTGGATASALSYRVAVTPPVTASPFTVNGATSLVVNGLTNGASYTFTVQASNSGGSGPPAAPTAPVVPAAVAGVRFHPADPTRAVDSRTATGWAGKLNAGTPRAATMTGAASAASIPSTATAVVLNITATGSNTNSFLTAYPAGQPVPAASNLNFAAGQTIANLATVRVGAGGQVSFATAQGSTDVVADIVGWYDDGTGPGDLFNPMSSQRFLDSRNATGWNGKLVAGASRELQVGGAGGVGGVPLAATAVVMNITVTGSNVNSYVTAFASDQPLPIASNVNFAAGETIANLATIKLGATGKITFATANGATDVIADVVGWYEPGAGNTFHTVLAPTRILDDRTGVGGYSTPVSAAAPRLVAVGGTNGVAASAVAVVANTTVANSTANSFVTVYPAGTPAPTASNLNFAAGQVIPNLVVSGLGAGGQVAVRTNQGQVSVIMDVSGYFAPT